MKEKDLYEILGVSPDTDEKELRKKYLKLAVQYHPDHNQGDSEASEKFKDISQAYSVLSSKESREKYDFYRKNENSSGFGGFNNYQSQNSGENFYYTNNSNLNFKFVDFEEAKKIFEQNLNDFQKNPEFQELFGFLNTININNLFSEGGVAVDEVNLNNVKTPSLSRIVRKMIWQHTKKTVKNSVKEKAGRVGNFFKNLVSKTKAGKIKNKKEYIEQSPDIIENIYLDEKNLTLGTELNHSYFQDGQERTLKIKVPKGLTYGDKLSLKGQGNLSSVNKTRGDLILRIVNL